LSICHLCAREIFKLSKDMASLLVSNAKNWQENTGFTGKCSEGVKVCKHLKALKMTADT